MQSVAASHVVPYDSCERGPKGSIRNFKLCPLEISGPVGTPEVWAGGAAVSCCMLFIAHAWEINGKQALDLMEPSLYYFSHKIFILNIS